MPEVSFIITAHNQLARTQACLASLHATLPSGLTHEIIVVDNASTDGTREFCKELGPPHVVLRNAQDLGYANSTNLAARRARGKFLALLSCDLVLQPGWLQPMLAAFAEYPRAGVVGNIQLHADTRQVSHAGILFVEGGFPRPHRLELVAAQAAGALIKMPAISTACCLVERKWFCLRGGFDEGYYHGIEDVDLCLRAREDGLVNLLATQSIVHCHAAPLADRDDHEFRNASRFLSRWGPRAAALEREWALQTARAHAAERARIFFTPLTHRLGLGPRALREQHRAALAAERAVRTAATRRIRIGVDVLRLTPGGSHGGVKPFIYSLLAEVGRQRGASIDFAFFAQDVLRDELATVLRDSDYLVTPRDGGFDVHQRHNGRWRAAGQLPAADATQRAALDVLYAPLGDSELMRPGLPCVSVIVDLLHRDLPAALPVEEVNHRESWFRRVTAEATWFQCISRHVISRLAEHYQVPVSRCFHVYLPVHGRLPEPNPSAAAPAETPDGPFFFYPANFWPHKNHETLLAAYQLYAAAAASRAWPLVLTGHPDACMELLRATAAAPGLAGEVHFLGHLPDAAFASLWSRAGALVFPSLHEGFGIPLLEAMRFGVPIIAHHSPITTEVAGEAYLPVDAHDPQALAEAMRRVAIRETLRAELAERGRIQLMGYSLELEAGRLAHFLEAAARGQTP